MQTNFTKRFYSPQLSETACIAVKRLMGSYPTDTQLANDKNNRTHGQNHAVGSKRSKNLFCLQRQNKMQKLCFSQCHHTAGTRKILVIISGIYCLTGGKMKHFKNCQSVEEAKKQYRKLLLQYHPDHAGQEGEAITKEIIEQFNAFLKSFMSHSFNSYYEDKDWKPAADAVTPFQDILQKIINFDCEIEIIGYWIYCFNSKEIREQLKMLGFWFSGKHKAWIYSGKPKNKRAGKETLDEIRAKKGSLKVEKEDQEKQRYPLKVAV